MADALLEIVLTFVVALFISDKNVPLTGLILVVVVALLSVTMELVPLQLLFATQGLLMLHVGAVPQSEWRRR